MNLILASTNGFCFLANWQLPTYNGTKSYQNLLVEVYGATWNSDWASWPNTNMNAIPQNLPFNFIRSGDYSYSSGSINSRSGTGYYWQFKANSDTAARHFDFYSTALRPQSAANKGSGFSLRCLVR